MQTIVEQLKKLAEDQPDIAGFYRQSMEFIADQLDAQAVIVWDCSSLPYHPMHQLNRDSGDAVRVGISQERHIELMEKAVSQDAAMFSSARDKDIPEGSFLLLCPVQRGQHRDLVEVFVDSTQPGQVYKRYQAALQAWCHALGEALSTDSFSEAPLRQVTTASSQTRFPLERFEQFSNNIHQSIDFKPACFNIANECQSLLECDRVTVVAFDRKAKARAISGLPKFNRRSNAIAALEKLATAVLKANQPLWYPDENAQALPQIADPLDRYLSAGVTRSIVIVPVTKCADDTRLSPEEIQHEAANPVIGGIIFENFSGLWQKQRMQVPVGLVGRHAAVAYRNAHQHKDLFLYPVWRSLGKMKILTSSRYLPKTLLACGLVLLLLASLFVIPARMTVSGNGTLVPKLRRQVFAQVPGKVEEVLVQHGSMVASGQPLVRMTSSDLELKLNEIDNKIALAQKQIESLNSRRMSTPANDRSANEIAQEDLEHASLLSQLVSFRNEKELYQKEIDRLRVTSPIDGQVVSNNLQLELLDRPVHTGQILMEIAETGGQWIVELDLPDRRIGHLQKARRDQGDELKATFILAAEPGVTHTGTVSLVALSTRVTPEAGHTILVTIKPDYPEAIQIRQVGTDVAVKIDCGPCSLGYSIFRDLGEFFQSKVLFHFQ